MPRSPGPRWPASTRPYLSGDDAAEILPAARFVARMARTFFPDKLKGKVSTAPPDGSVCVYLVCKLPELEADLVESWENTPAAVNRR